MRVRVEHETTFRYATPAHASFDEVRLTPRNDERQNLLDCSLQIDPPARTTSYVDHFGTVVHAFNLWPAHDHLTIRATSTVVTSMRRVPPDDAGELDALEDPVLRDHEAEWLHSSPLASGGDHLDTFAQHVRRVVKPSSVAELVRGVCREVHGRFRYRSGSSYVSSTVDDLLERGTGVCQDFAHLSIATLRDLGIPARYVSGYFYAGPPNDLRFDVPLEVQSHAWVEALIPGWGWHEIDPTNDCPADERHVVVAVGRDYGDVSPVRGVVRGGAAELAVSVTMVAPSEHAPRRAVQPMTPNPRDALTSVRAERARRRSHADSAPSAGVAQSPASIAQAQQQQQ